MKILFYSVLLTCSMAVIYSCKKKSDTPAPATNTKPVDMRTGLNKKWNTGNSTSRVAVGAVANDYVSFEFNATGKYYIIMADKSLLSGTFTLNTVDSLVTLFNANSTTSQYGTLTISSITDLTLTFKFTLNGTSSPIAINTTAAPVTIATATGIAANQTDSLAQAWSLTRYTQGASTYDLTGTTAYANIVLTTSGTYWTEVYDGSTAVQTNTGQWIWSDATQTRICTSSTNAVPNCSTNSQTVTFDANGNLILTTTPTGQATTTYYYKKSTL
jgi:hypothetical protein